MKKLILVLTLFANISAYARDCSSYETDKISYLAELQGRKIVNSKYQGGKDITTRVTRCEYNSYTEQFYTEIDINWYGSLSGKYYNSSGVMKLNSDSISYKETYRNQNLKDYAFWRGIATIAIVTGAIAEHQDK